MKKLYLIDGSGFIFRAFHALPPLTRPDGTPIGAVLGFTRMLMKLLQDHGEDPIAVIFDAARYSFRHDIYKDYKANRPPPPDDLVPQFALVREAVKAFNVPSIEMHGYEADDVIATYAQQAAASGVDVVIVSSDKDLMQLIDDHICLWDPIKNKKIGRDEVIEKFGVPPEKVIEVQALIGDSTDHVPGVPSIGVKTAAELIQAYGNLEMLLAQTETIKQPKRREVLTTYADQARLSKQLVTLKTDVPVPQAWSTLYHSEIDYDKLREFLQQQGFHSILAGLDKWQGSSDPTFAKKTGAYAWAKDKNAIQSWLEKAQKAPTLALQFYDQQVEIDGYKTSILQGIALCCHEGEPFYIPLQQAAEQQSLLDQTPSSGFLTTEVLGWLQPILENDAILKVGYDVKALYHHFTRYGIDLKPMGDVMLLSYLLSAGLHGHGLSDLMQRYLDITKQDKKNLFGKKTWEDIDIQTMAAYAGEEVDAIYRLFPDLYRQLVKDHKTTLYETMERPLINVLAKMEECGIKVDAIGLKRQQEELDGKIKCLEKEIHDCVGRVFTIGSPKQLGDILFEELKLPGGKKGKSGSYGTDSDVLEKLVFEKCHPLPQKILDWRQLTKIKSTYCDALLKEINPKTGRIHTNYGMTVALTGRLSSSNPNLQNIPIRSEEGRKIRAAFVADVGWSIVSLDYSQIELRLLADMADITQLKEAFYHGLDIHAATASEVLGVPLDQITPELRRQAKAINFGIIYGISAFGLSQQLGIDVKDAKQFIEIYFARYPGIVAYMEKMKEEARSKGYVQTIFGRTIHLPGIRDKNPVLRSFAERQAINAPLQGSAADIIKRAMVKAQPALDAHGLRARLLLQVHDELVFEVPNDELDATIPILREIMENAPEPVFYPSVPLKMGVGIGPNWEEAH